MLSIYHILAAKHKPNVFYLKVICIGITYIVNGYLNYYYFVDSQKYTDTYLTQKSKILV